MGTSPATEARRFARFPFPHKLILRTNDGSRAVLVRALDISEAGLGVSLPDEYQIEEPVRAWLLYGDQRLLRCEGILRHRTAGRIGIELADGNTEHLVALRALSDGGGQSRD